MYKTRVALLSVAAILFLTGCAQPATRGAAPQGAPDGPKFVVDPFWPQPLRDNWIFGQVAGLSVDTRDHVWITHRPRSLVDDEKGAQANPPTTRCCTAPPAVMEFDPQGNFVRG